MPFIPKDPVHFTNHTQKLLEPSLKNSWLWGETWELFNITEQHYYVAAEARRDIDEKQSIHKITDTLPGNRGKRALQ